MRKELAQRFYDLFKLILAVLYFVGFILHLFDVMNLRLHFTEMNLIWKSWIIFLLIFDLFTSLGLFFKKSWGELFFLVVSISQLIAYIGFSSVFGEQKFLIIFHFISLSIYGVFKVQKCFK